MLRTCHVFCREQNCSETPLMLCKDDFNRKDIKKIRLSKTSSRLMVTAALKKILRGVSK